MFITVYFTTCNVSDRLCLIYDVGTIHYTAWWRPPQSEWNSTQLKPNLSQWFYDADIILLQLVIYSLARKQYSYDNIISLVQNQD